MKLSPTPWRVGNGSFIVSDEPGEGLVPYTGHDDGIQPATETSHAQRLFVAF